MKRHLLNSLVALATLACGLGTADVASAIDIVLVWDDLDENPEFDPDGTKLMAVATAAAQMWERLIPSAGTHDVDISWSQLDPGQLGYWKLDPFGNNNLYFNKDADWFVDSTPADHSEYDFGVPLDFSSGKGSFLAGTTPDIGDWFDGSPVPYRLEIGYVGKPTASAPSAAMTDFDLLSVVLHELGHDLGVGGDELSGRYPMYPAHLSGAEGVEVVEGNFDDPDGEGFGEEHGHVAPPMALMSPSIGPGERTLPSAMDVLVAARDSNYLSVDLERKFVGVGTNWNTSSTWIGGRIPDGSDDAYVFLVDSLALSGAGRADNLFVSSSLVETGANSLTVDNLLAVGGGGGGGGLRIDSGGTAMVGRIEAHDSGIVRMNGGTLNLLNDGFVSGEIFGQGRVDVSGQIVVTGQVEAEGGPLELTGNGSILLLRTDEFGSGLLRADSGDLKLGLAFAPGSSGDIVVNQGRRLVITRDLTIPKPVVVNLEGMLTSEGANTDVTISNLQVGFESTAQVLARTLTLNDYAFLDQGSHLTLASPVRTTLQGGFEIFGSGTLKQDGDILVTGGEVNLAVQTLDWGNSTPTQSNDLRINPNSTLEVNSAVVGTYRGTLTVDSATLQVDTPGGWQLGGENATTAGGILSMIQSGATPPTVRGTPLTARNLIIASGNSYIESDLTVMPTAQLVVFGAASQLFLRGHTTLRGGSVTGLGTLVQSGDIDVTENTTIDTKTFSWGNSFATNINTLTVHAGDTLTVNSSSTGNANNQFRGALRLDGGTLVVNTDGGWTLPAQQVIQIPGILELVGGAVPPRVQGQALTVAGRINVIGGPAHLDSDVVFQSTQQTDIAAGATLHVNGAATYIGGTFTGLGTLQHNGTALLSSNNPLTASRFLQNGLFTVINPSNNAAIHAPVIDFLPGSLTKLFLDLHLQGDAILRQGATFEGGGTLVIDPTASFTGGGNLGVDLENQGIVRPGFSPGVLNVAGDYTQGASGTLEIDVAGTSRGDWDLLAASGNVSLSGMLNVFLLGGFTPALGDSFTIVTAAGGLSGTFSDILFPPLPVGQTWSIDYSRTSVVLSTIIGVPGDTNGDLTVDLEDLNNVRNNFGGSGTGIDGDTNGDGLVNLADLNAVRNNFGVSAPRAVPEPSTILLAACGLVAVALLRVRRI